MALEPNEDKQFWMGILALVVIFSVGYILGVNS